MRPMRYTGIRTDELNATPSKVINYLKGVNRAYEVIDRLEAALDYKQH